MKRNLFAAVLTCVLMMFSTTVWATELSGKVYSKGAPVANLTVAVKGTEQKTKTDATGEYKLDLGAGEHTLIIRGKEYVVKVNTETTRLDIQLQ
jgi:hypothetical protein